MGSMQRLTASDGHELGAYRADPAGAAKGAVVIIQEIFGVNSHIRAVCDRVAAEGYVAIAPAIFDRIEPDFESGYSADELAKAREFIPKLDLDAALLDAEAARKAVADVGKVAIIGFCLGGRVAFLAATGQDGWNAAICYYGGGIANVADRAPRCPTQMHFGDQDASIPMEDVETIQTKRADCDIHVYAGAQHGFNCDQRATHDADSAAQAWTRSMDWLSRHLA